MAVNIKTMMLQVMRISKLLLERFDGDIEKCEAWMTTSNLNFGGFSPVELLKRGRGHKVIEFIESSKEAD